MNHGESNKLIAVLERIATALESGVKKEFRVRCSSFGCGDRCELDAGHEGFYVGNGHGWGMITGSSSP